MLDLRILEEDSLLPVADSFLVDEDSSLMTPVLGKEQAANNSKIIRTNEWILEVNEINKPSVTAASDDKSLNSKENSSLILN